MMKRTAFEAAYLRVNTKRIQRALLMYAQGRTIREIAQFHSCTPERVRVMILKGIRRATRAAS